MNYYIIGGDLDERVLSHIHSVVDASKDVVFIIGEVSDRRFLKSLVGFRLYCSYSRNEMGVRYSPVDSIEGQVVGISDFEDVSKSFLDKNLMLVSVTYKNARTGELHDIASTIIDGARPDIVNTKFIPVESMEFLCGIKDNRSLKNMLELVPNVVVSATRMNTLSFNLREGIALQAVDGIRYNEFGKYQYSCDWGSAAHLRVERRFLRSTDVPITKALVEIGEYNFSKCSTGYRDIVLDLDVLGKLDLNVDVVEELTYYTKWCMQEKFRGYIYLTRDDELAIDYITRLGFPPENIKIWKAV